jgi:hypothetical protein
MRIKDGEIQIIAMARRGFALHVWCLNKRRSTNRVCVREEIRYLTRF